MIRQWVDCYIIWMISFFCGRRNTRDCKIIMSHFHSCMSYMGVPVAGENTEGPTTVLLFLVFGLDYYEMVVPFPQNYREARWPGG